jgi:hypothetical protein
LAIETVFDQFDHLFGDRVPRQFALVVGRERGVLEFAWSGADQPVAIDMGRQEEAIGRVPLCDEDPFELVDFDLDFFKFSSDDAEERIFAPNDRRLADQLPEDVEKMGKVDRELGGDQLASPITNIAIATEKLVVAVDRQRRIVW